MSIESLSENMTNNLEYTTEKLTPELYEQLLKDIQPLIVAIGIFLCVFFSAYGTASAIIQSSNILTMNVYKPGLQVYIFMIGGFAFFPFLLATILIFILSSSLINPDVSFYRVSTVSIMISTFGIINGFLGYSMGIIAPSTVKMVSRDSNQRLKLVLSYAMLEVSSVFSFIIILVLSLNAGKNISDK